jgi:prevent-host-death family protein
MKIGITEFKTKFSNIIGRVRAGEETVICSRGVPVARFVPFQPPIDLELRKSAFGLFARVMDEAELHEALRPMTDEEADAFVDGRY